EPGLGQQHTQSRTAERVAARDALREEAVGLAGPASARDLVADEPQLLDLIARVEALPALRALRDNVAVARFPRSDGRGGEVEHPSDGADAEQRNAPLRHLAPIPCVHLSLTRRDVFCVMTRHLHYGPARVPSRESPDAAIDALLQRGFSACEIDFEGRFWMDYEFAETFGELAVKHDIALSVHAPIAGFMGHAERGKKLNMAVGMLDHSAGIAKAAGAELVVFHPGFLLGRTREAAIDSIVEQLGELRERLEAKDRAVPFGIEVMGRVREIGSLDDVCEISSRLDWVRPGIDLAHMHATSDGALLSVQPFAQALLPADAVLEPLAPVPDH